MKATFSSALRNTGCAFALSAALAATAHADSVLTVNADGTVSQVEAPRAMAPQTAPQGMSTNGTAPQGMPSSGSVSALQVGPGGVNATHTRDGRFRTQPFPYPGHDVSGKHKKVIVKPGTDVIIDGDHTKVIIKPGYPYYGYPGYVGNPFYGYPGYSYRYPVVGHPYYHAPNYGYPHYGSPYYGTPYYGSPSYGYPGYGGGYPVYGYGGAPAQVNVYGPGTYSSTHRGTVNGGFGGVTVGRDGLSVNLGGGQQSINSRTTTTVMPGTTVTTVTPGGVAGMGLPSPYVMTPQSRPF